MMKNFEYTLTANTLTLIENMKKAAKAQQDAHSKATKTAFNKAVDEYSSLVTEANKALTVSNKAIQTDIFDAILATDNPLMTLCEVGVYKVDAFKVDKKNGLTFSKVEKPLSLSAFLAYAHSKGKLTLPSDYRSIIQTAVKFSAVQTANAYEINLAPHIKRLNLSASEMETVFNPFSGDFTASKSLVRSSLQTVVNTLFGMDGDKARYWVHSADVNVLSSLFAVNRVTLQFVVPLDDTMLEMVFVLLRHIVGGWEYGMMVKGGEKKASK